MAYGATAQQLRKDAAELNISYNDGEFKALRDRLLRRADELEAEASNPLAALKERYAQAAKGMSCQRAAALRAEMQREVHRQLRASIQRPELRIVQ